MSKKLERLLSVMLLPIIWSNTDHGTYVNDDLYYVLSFNRNTWLVIQGSIGLKIGKSITDSNLSNFLLIRFLATDPMYITYNNSVAARYLT